MICGITIRITDNIMVGYHMGRYINSCDCMNEIKKFWPEPAKSQSTIDHAIISIHDLSSCDLSLY